MAQWLNILDFGVNETKYGYNSADVRGEKYLHDIPDPPPLNQTEQDAGKLKYEQPAFKKVKYIDKAGNAQDCGTALFDVAVSVLEILYEKYPEDLLKLNDAVDENHGVIHDHSSGHSKDFRLDENLFVWYPFPMNQKDRMKKSPWSYFPRYLLAIVLDYYLYPMTKKYSDDLGKFEVKTLE